MASTAPELFDIKPVCEHDYENIIDFLRKFFYHDEPLNRSTKLLANGTCPSLDKYCLKSLSNGNSIMAVTKAGKLIGVSVNKINRRGITEELDEIEDPKFLKIATFLGYLEDKADVFRRYPDVDSEILVDILSVDESYRGYGIAKKLIDKTRANGKEKGVQLMRIDCSSLFSAKATAKLGFDCIYRINYTDYKVNGEQVFEPEHPHTEATVFVQRIDGKPLAKL